MKFKVGDMLIIKPADNDDPIANELAGRRCRFSHYSASSLFAGCYVQLSTKGIPFVLREKDLQHETNH